MDVLNSEHEELAIFDVLDGKAGSTTVVL